MAMTQAGRGTAIYNAIASNNANFSSLSTAEKAALQASIQAIWGAGDLVYIQANAEADPGATLVTTAASIIAPAGGGACTGTGTITGKGTIA